jgi:transcriptional regulator of acetoin/glycerol metabolism
LFSLVGPSSCAKFLTDTGGVFFDQRLPDDDAVAFANWGLCTGKDLSEAREGLNGIDPCLTKQHHVIVH